MTLDRRTFIIQAGTLLATAPVLAIALRRPSAVQTSFMNGAAANQNPIHFKIDGWDTFNGEASNGNEVWLRFNQSWRCMWR